MPQSSTSQTLTKMAMLRRAFVLLLVVLPVGLCNIFTDWEEHPWEAKSLNCEQGLREFNPVTQKQKYTIGGWF